MQGERYIAAADLGSSKVALCVAKVEGDDVQVIFYKELPSEGIRHSIVLNPEKASHPLKALIAEAESELGIKILQLVVGLPRHNVSQVTASADIKRSDPESCITKEEINTVKSIATDSYPLQDPTKQKIYGAVAQSFSADDEINAKEEDIIGMTGDQIEGNFKIFIGTQKAVKNVDMLLNKVGVAPAYKLFVPGCTAETVLTETEKDNGVALLEIGAGVSSVTIYKGKRLRHYSSIPFGAKTITNDIRLECGFTERLAENIKLAYGACMPDKLQTLGDKTIQIYEEGGENDQLPVKYLSEIITYRCKEIVDALLYHIQESGFADSLRSGVVLTGGCANLLNLANFIKQESGYNVRIGYARSGKFSSEGYPGVGETGAVTTIGMILEAKKDFYLNCLEEMPMVEEDEAPVSSEAGDETASTEESPSDELFPTSDVTIEVNPVKVEEKRKKKKRENKDGGRQSVTWKVFKKINSGLETAFENTVGTLFDSVNTNENDNNGR